MNDEFPPPQTTVLEVETVQDTGIIIDPITPEPLQLEVEDSNPTIEQTISANDGNEPFVIDESMEERLSQLLGVATNNEELLDNSVDNGQQFTIEADMEKRLAELIQAAADRSEDRRVTRSQGSDLRWSREMNPDDVFEHDGDEG